MTKKYAPKVHCCVQHIDIKDFCKKEAGCSGEGERFNTWKCPCSLEGVEAMACLCSIVMVRTPYSAVVRIRASSFKGWIWAPQLSPAEPVRYREEKETFLPQAPSPCSCGDRPHTRQEQLDKVSWPPTPKARVLPLCSKGSSSISQADYSSV